MTLVPGAEDDGFWYEAGYNEALALSSRGNHAASWVLSNMWRDWEVFLSLSHAYQAAKAGDRTAQRLLKETYERYIVKKLTS